MKDVIYYHGWPSYLSQSAEKILVSTYQVMDHAGTPLYKDEVAKIVHEAHCNEMELDPKEDKLPHQSTMKKITTKLHIPFHTGKPAHTSDMRKKKTQPEYLSGFFSTLKSLILLHDLKSTEMYE